MLLTLAIKKEKHMELNNMCTHSPWLVTEVVNGLQRVDAGDPGIMQTDD